ncbi:hypothetical protein [Sphingosinicella terrae]|uniref:hypothetical protein n=1 Tax=Sphingosinicella terrae TaxID=2172047 RepID=UPI000E0DD33C|nr:hypothetical protein [Sphingosinicella terrae]
MLGFAALLLAAQPATADAALLDTFRAACERVGDLEAMQADARQGGWTAIADEADPRLARVNRSVRDGTSPENRLTLSSYRAEPAGEPLFLVVSRVENDQGMWIDDCRVYAFGAAPIAGTALEAWMGRPPTSSDDFGGVGLQLDWEPGWRDGMAFRVSHAPPGGALARQLGQDGNILVAQSLGGF